jgi:hypothetical protein
LFAPALGLVALMAVGLLTPGNAWAEPLVGSGAAHCGTRAIAPLADHFQSLGFDLLVVKEDGTGSVPGEPVPGMPCRGPSCSGQKKPVSPPVLPQPNPPVPDPWALGLLGALPPELPGAAWPNPDSSSGPMDRAEEIVEPPWGLLAG